MRLTWLVPWSRGLARRAAARALAAAEAEQRRERERARQRLLYQSRGGQHWSRARTEAYPYTAPVTPAQNYRGDGGRR